MPAHRNHAIAARHPLPENASGRPQRLRIPPASEPGPPVGQTARKRPAAEPARDLAAAVEPPFVPARGDAAVVAIRDRIAAELVRAHDLSPEKTPAGKVPDLEGATVRVTAARLPAAPLAVTVPYAGVGWAARLQRADWSERGTAMLVYELRRFSLDRL